MLNLRQLTRPSPNDANLRTTGDPLGMLRMGDYDRNRFGFYHNAPHKKINNQTGNIFNHIRTPTVSPMTPSLHKQNPTKIKNYVTSYIPFINPLIYGQPNLVAFTDKPLLPTSLVA